MSDQITAIEGCRRSEKEQALFYRALAALAEGADEIELAQRFHDLHADEQHHLSRLTARLIELGHPPDDLADAKLTVARLDDWEPLARDRELAEIDGYRDLLSRELDESTRALAEAILGVEASHAEELGGKWTMA